MRVFDKRARKILLDAHWESKHGWLSENSRARNTEDISYAKSKGYWFDDVEFYHDETVSNLINVKKEITEKEVGDAFLASLSSRRLELRSALASFSFARHFPDHQIESSESYRLPTGATCCEICGFCEFDKPRITDLNVFNFERHKWGGVQHADVIYAWFDLSQFKREIEIRPTAEDKEIMRAILRTAANLPDEAPPSVLAKELGGVLKSNIAERRICIEILSTAGILQPRHRSGYFSEFSSPFQREHTGEHLNDWNYPAIWWRGVDGIDESAVSVYFGDI
ncbi:MAG: hypothetical protein ABJ370_19385 [Paracoccaceae bacterium]